MDCGVYCFNEKKINALRKLLPERETILKKADVFKALGHPIRVAICSILSIEESCVCDLANILEIPVANASQHLKTLKTAGILVSRQEGKLVFYRIADTSMVRFIDGEICQMTTSS